MNLKLAGKTVAVTGGSKGIGNAIAHRFAEEGANVAICARTHSTLEAAATEIQDRHGVACEPFVADLTNRNEARAFIEGTVDEFDRLDVLVNNAGSAPGGNLSELDEDDWYQAIDLKLMGYVRCTTEAMSHLVETQGAVVNIAGIAGVQPFPGGLTSVATNSADINLTRALAKGCGREGVRVNVVSPGSVATDRWKDIMQKRADRRGVSFEEAVELAEWTVPLGRICTPEEVANVVVFLGSEEASFVNGVSMSVDGGQMADLFEFDRIKSMSDLLS